MNTEFITAVVVAVITAVGTIICQLLINRSNREKSAAENRETKNLIIYRLGELEKKQDKYNHLQERVYNLERAQAVADKELKVANHRIDDLEKGA